MPDWEKVIKGLEAIVNDDWMWKKADYYAGICKDALALLKAQEPRVMTLEDIKDIGPEDVCAFIEIREESHMYGCYMRQYDEMHTEIFCNVPNIPTKLQEGCTRIWTSRPTDEQREATPWE